MGVEGRAGGRKEREPLCGVICIYEVIDISPSNLDSSFGFD